MLERIPKILFSVAVFFRFDSKFNQAHVYCENKLEHLAVYVFMSSGLREGEHQTFPVRGRESPIALHPNRLKYRQFMELGLASSFISNLREFSPKKASFD